MSEIPQVDRGGGIVGPGGPDETKGAEETQPFGRVKESGMQPAPGQPMKPDYDRLRSAMRQWVDQELSDQELLDRAIEHTLREDLGAESPKTMFEYIRRRMSEDPVLSAISQQLIREARS